MNQFKVSIPTLRGVCAGFAISALLAACALEPDGSDADSVGEIGPEVGLDLWTGVKKPPYRAAALSLSHRVLELSPDSTGDILLEASLRWRDYTGGAIEPQVTFGLATDSSEALLAQVFESRGQLRTRADLAMSDVLEVGAWYRVSVTIGEAPGRPVQVRILDSEDVEVWRSCDAGRCPSVQVDPTALDSLRLTVSVDDLREGLGQIELKNISLQRNP